MGNCCESKEGQRRPATSCCAEENGGKDPQETLRLRSDESINPARPDIIRLHPVSISNSFNSSIVKSNKEDSHSYLIDQEEASIPPDLSSLLLKRDVAVKSPKKWQKISEVPDFLVNRIPKPSQLVKTISCISDSIMTVVNRASAYQFDDGLIYRGEWQNKMREGVGEQIWPDGMYYIGTWRMDERDGPGRLVLPDGTVFEGHWNRGQLNYGFLIKRDDVYEGYMFNGKKNGQGSMQWTDGKSYKGDWKSGLMHGKGMFKWPNGRSYVGEYRNGKKFGYGEFKWPNGKEFRGMWNGSSGQGICIMPDRTQIKVQWEDGKVIKELDQI